MSWYTMDNKDNSIINEILVCDAKSRFIHIKLFYHGFNHTDIFDDAFSRLETDKESWRSIPCSLLHFYYHCVRRGIERIWVF